MAEVLLNLGSNIDRKQNLCSGLDALQRLFGSLRHSSVYESEAAGIEGDPFYNLTVVIRTTLSPGKLAERLRRVEDFLGRDTDKIPGSSGILDIDILTYDFVVGVVDGVVLPRPELREYAFMLGPTAELKPLSLHPVCLRSYEELWQAFDRQQLGLRRVDFFWLGIQISHSDSVGHINSLARRIPIQSNSLCRDEPSG